MAPGKNKPPSGGGTGLKILWIPGRKKHHDKGTYRPTNYKVEQKHAEKKNEPWSLGGSKAHDEIVAGDDKDDKHDILNASTPTSTILPSASLSVTAINIDDCSDSSEAEIKLEKKDLDSIERLDDIDGQPKWHQENGKTDQNGKSKGSKSSSNCAKKEKEEKTVKCLYYTMMCCECTIS